MIKKKISVVTGTRAEYGLLYNFLKLAKKDNEIELQLIVTGMHLSPEFGLTYKQIEKDGFKITEKVEMLLSSDTYVGISKSMGLAMIGFGEVYQKLKPDIVVLLGDRYEIFCASSAAMVANIPIAHIHGGETTEGAIDEPIRHSITKMAHIHFATTETYRNRIIQLGEHPARTFNAGSPGLDSLDYMTLLGKNELEKSIGFKMGKINAIVTYHPVTLENKTAKGQISELLQALDEFKEMNFIFTMPNSDPDGRVIITKILEYVNKNKGRCIARTSLGHLRYLSVMKHFDLVIGNSSSGVIETPSFGIPTINIGDRQKGRVRADSVIDCSPKKKEIIKAIKKCRTPEFRAFCKKVKNPYYKKGTAKKILQEIKNLKITEKLLKKTFYNFDGKKN